MCKMHSDGTGMMPGCMRIMTLFGKKAIAETNMYDESEPASPENIEKYGLAKELEEFLKNNR